MAEGNKGKSYRTPTTDEKHVSTETKTAFLRAFNRTPMLTPKIEAELDEQLGMPVRGAIFGSAFDPDRDLERLDSMIDEIDKEPTAAELAVCEEELAEEAA